MNCSVCGAKLDENGAFCTVCGVSITEPVAVGKGDAMPQASSIPGNTIPQPMAPGNETACWNSVQPSVQSATSAREYGVDVPPLPMKWFKFVIYFQLFAGAALLLVNAVQYLTGSLYGSMAADVYLFYGPGLKFLDVAMGVFSIALAALFIVARQKLAKFKRSGPSWYIAVLAANLALTVVYLIAVIGMTGVGAYDMIRDAASRIASPIVLIIVNVIYFKKRKHLFVN